MDYCSLLNPDFSTYGSEYGYTVIRVQW
jgi:hypothetical protein